MDEDGREPGPRESNLIAQIAHELKSPLGAIVAAAEMMAEQRLGPMQNEQYRVYAQNIASSGRHALEVLARALEDWRQLAEPAPLSFVELDLNAIVERTVSALQPLARERGQTIAASLEEGLPHLIADATSLRQILINLVMNGVRHAGDGARISVETSSVLDGPVSLRISDTGPGLDQAQIAKLTGEGPERLDSAVALEGLGLKGGLGLKIVGRLAAANGASIQADSRRGEGTRITIAFGKDKVVPV